MKKSLFTLLVVVLIAMACNANRNLANIQPKLDTLEIPANGELRVWKTIMHAGFDVVLKNNTANQSCEVYLYCQTAIYKSRYR